MCDVRIIACEGCGGDGWFMEGPDERPPQRCECCKGSGETEIDVEPIEMEDLE